MAASQVDDEMAVLSYAKRKSEVNGRSTQLRLGRSQHDAKLKKPLKQPRQDHRISNVVDPELIDTQRHCRVAL
jgi:hypothetical protein